MASKKRKKKIAGEGGYNWERNNAHIQRKKIKVKLKKNGVKDDPALVCQATLKVVGR